MYAYRQRFGTIILFLSDIVILFLIAVCAVAVRNFLPRLIPGYPAFSRAFNYQWWVLPIWLTILAYEGAYTKKFTFWDEVKLTWTAAFFATVSLLTIVSLGKLSYAVSRTLVMIMGIFALVLHPLLRIAVKRVLIRAGLLRSKVLILGTSETAKSALTALRKEPNLGYDVVGFISEETAADHRTIDGIKVHQYLDKVERYVQQCDIQAIVIAASGTEKDKVHQLVNRLQHKVRSILYIPDYSGMAVIGTELRHFFHDQVFALEIKNNLARPFNYYAKKLFDYAVGALLFALIALPLLVISALIRSTSKGPAILRQKRIGKKGSHFTCYKFRTMHRNADEQLKKVLDTDPEAKAEWETHWKLKNDPRVTSIGGFLRTTSLDELPQIFNVLRGEMSLIGPRPYLPREWNAIKDYSETIHSVLPGITGLWQVSGRSNSSYEQRLSLDAWYVRNWNLWLDIVILLKTIRVVLKSEGAA